MKKFHFALIIAVTLLLITSIGCTSTYTSSVTKEKAPIFNLNENVIQANLNKIVKCENIKIEGYEIAINGGKSNTVLEMRFLNGSNIPKDQNKIYLKAKELAKEIQKSLKDTEQYQKYTIIFEMNESYGPISKEGSQTIEFTLKEL